MHPLWRPRRAGGTLPHRYRLRHVYLHAEKESPKYEKAAMKFLRRYLDEKSPTLKNFATVVRELEQRQSQE